MKIELIKETKFSGEVFYSIEIDGHYVDKSTTCDEAQAEVYYELIVKYEGAIKMKEVLKSTEL